MMKFCLAILFCLLISTNIRANNISPDITPGRVLTPIDSITLAADAAELAQLSGKLQQLRLELDFLQQSTISLNDTIPDDENEDIRKLKALRKSINEMIVDIDHRITRLDSAQVAASSRESSLGGKLFRSIKSNFTERKVTWLRDIRSFLYTEQDRLDGITKGISSASAKITEAKLKVISKLKGIL